MIKMSYSILLDLYKQRHSQVQLAFYKVHSLKSSLLQNTKQSKGFQKCKGPSANVGLTSKTELHGHISCMYIQPSLSQHTQQLQPTQLVGLLLCRNKSCNKCTKLAGRKHPDCLADSMDVKIQIGLIKHINWIIDLIKFRFVAVLAQIIVDFSILHFSSMLFALNIFRTQSTILELQSLS